MPSWTWFGDQRDAERPEAARNLDDLRALVREFTESGIAVGFVRERMTFTGKDSPQAPTVALAARVRGRVRTGAHPRAAARGHRAGQ